MKTKALFKNVLKTTSYILVFLWTSTSAFAQCPTISNPTPTICDASGFTFNDLNAFATDNGNGIVWYDALSGGNAFILSELVE